MRTAKTLTARVARARSIWGEEEGGDVHSRCPLGQAFGKELCEFFVRGFVFEAIVDDACAVVAGRPWALGYCWGILLERHGVPTFCASVCCWSFNGGFSRYGTNSRC